MDVGHARGQGLHLALAQRGAQRLHLAVDVRFGNMVEVDQRQLSHTAACQRLHRPRADPPEADDGDARGTQPHIAFVAVEAPQAAEAAFEVGGEIDDHAMRSTRQVW